MAEPGSGLRARAERIADALPPMLVAAQRVAATVMHGIHGRRRAGNGETFWQFRRYQPGDAATLIDWRQSAKTEAHFVREQEWEAAQSIWLWSDGSPSMAYRSRRDLPTKAERAQLILLAAAALLARGGEQIAWLGSERRPARGDIALNRVAETCLSAEAPEPLPPRSHLPRHAHVVIVSDFLEPLDDWKAVIDWFVGSGIDGHLVQVLDPAEQSLPFQGRARFFGLEQEGSALIGRVEAVRDQYVARLNAHRQALGEMARRAGWALLEHHTDKSAELAVTMLYQSLSGQLGNDT